MTLQKAVWWLPEPRIFFWNPFPCSHSSMTAGSPHAKRDQKSIAYTRFADRFFIGIGAINESDPMELFLETDLLLPVQFLEHVDIPGEPCAGKQNQMFSSCNIGLVLEIVRISLNCLLGGRNFLRLRGYLGFQSLTEPLEALKMTAEDLWLNQIVEKQVFAFAPSLQLGEVMFEHRLLELEGAASGCCSQHAKSWDFQEICSHVKMWKKQSKCVCACTHHYTLHCWFFFKEFQPVISRWHGTLFAT